VTSFSGFFSFPLSFYPLSPSILLVLSALTSKVSRSARLSLSQSPISSSTTSLRTSWEKEKEPMAGMPQAFEQTVIVLNAIGERLDLLALTACGNETCCFEFLECFGRGSLFSDIDDPWFCRMRGEEGLHKEVPGRLCISARTEPKVERLAPLHQPPNTATSTRF
jgi:hypothetical protein